MSLFHLGTPKAELQLLAAKRTPRVTGLTLNPTVIDKPRAIEDPDR